MSEEQSLGRIAELSFQLVHDEIKLAGAIREFSSKYISGSNGAPHASRNRLVLIAAGGLRCVALRYVAGNQD